MTAAPHSAGRCAPGGAADAARRLALDQRRYLRALARIAALPEPARLAALRRIGRHTQLFGYQPCHAHAEWRARLAGLPHDATAARAMLRGIILAAMVIE